MDERKEQWRKDRWIVPGKNRALQTPRGVDRRVKFTKAKRETFLEHLAATCNVSASAAEAEVSLSLVYRWRMRDPEFRDTWSAAIEQGYARLEAALIERATRGEAKPRVEGDKQVEGPDSPQEIDWDKGFDLLRQHQRGIEGSRPHARLPQRAPIEEVAATLIRKFKALGVRLDDEAGDDEPENDGAGA